MICHTLFFLNFLQQLCDYHKMTVYKIDNELHDGISSKGSCPMNFVGLVQLHNDEHYNLSVTKELCYEPLRLGLYLNNRDKMQHFKHEWEMWKISPYQYKTWFSLHWISSYSRAPPS